MSTSPAPLAEASLPELSAPPPRCPNCESVAEGRFCAACGQRQGPLSLDTRALLAEMADELLNVDAKLPRTLRGLFRPGFLSLEYFAGRRDRYVRPFRIFVVASFVMFLGMALAQGRFVPRQPANGKTAQPQQVSPFLSLFQNHRELFGAHLDRFSQGGPAAQMHRISAAYLDLAPKANLLALPFFALLLAGLFRRSHRSYADHFVFGLHYHAFYFLLETALLGVQVFLPTRWLGALGLAFTLLVWSWVAVALRRIYLEGWGWTLLKMTLLIAGYAVFQVGLTLSMLAVAILRA